MSTESVKIKPQSKKDLTSKTIGVWYHLVAIELFVTYVNNVQQGIYSSSVMKFLFSSILIIHLVGLFILAGQGLWRKKDWAKPVAIWIGIFYLIPVFLIFFLEKIPLNAYTIGRLWLYINLLGAVIYLIITTAGKLWPITIKKGTKRKMCKHCFTKLSIDVEVCSHCGRQLSARDTTPI